MELPPEQPRQKKWRFARRLPEPSPADSGPAAGAGGHRPQPALEAGAARLRPVRGGSLLPRPPADQDKLRRLLAGEQLDPP